MAGRDGPGLLDALAAKAASLGLALRERNADGFTAEIEAITAKWPLGRRLVTYRMSCRLAEAERVARFREVVIERSRGWAPPRLWLERTRIRGWTLSGSLDERSPGGGGALDYGQVREALAGIVAGAGWRFHLEGGRMP